MDDKKTVTVNIVNRDYPPYKGITGESATELAKYLLDAGFQVNVIHTNVPFWGINNSIPAGNTFKVKTFYSGKNKILRLFANLISGYFLIKKSKKIPSDVTIVMTDPSLLNMWASILLKKRKWILWSMDLYPEAFAAGKLISANNFLYKKIYRLTVRNAPQHIISLGPRQAAYLKNRYEGRVVNFSYLPCGIYDAEKHIAADKPQWANDTTKTYLGYCGNLSTSHSMELLYAIADNFDAEKFKLVLSVYGLNVQPLIQYVQDKKGIELIPFVERAHLKFIDIHIASLLPQWSHVSVPSKTVSSVCAGSAFLFYGNEDSDNWFLLKKAGWLIPYGENLEKGVINFFQQFDINSLEQKKSAARKIAKNLNMEKTKTFQEISASIRNLTFEQKT
jgi:hypothetical protein